MLPSPISLFCQGFSFIRDNLKRELFSLIASCVQAPRTSKGVMLKSGRSFRKDAAQNHWQIMVENLTSLLKTLKENFVPPVLCQKIFTQVFSFVNV
ncbi:hypothetical protein Droror1_Dr00024216 [Drosera rotundifolia]